MKLNQIIAISNGEKTKKQSVLTNTYQLLAKRDLFEGVSKRYAPFEEDPMGKNTLPSEDKLVQMTVEQAIYTAREVMESMFNAVATQDKGNCKATGDIVVDQTQPGVGTVIASNVPVTTLLFLEKQLNDIRTFVSALPMLDPAELWEEDEVTGQWKTGEKVTFRSKKMFKNHVKAIATDKHPAQVDVYTEDEPIGRWTTVRFSGATRQIDKENMLEKIDNLDKAVKVAREIANGTEIEKVETGGAILRYIFG